MTSALLHTRLQPRHTHRVCWRRLAERSQPLGQHKHVLGNALHVLQQAVQRLNLSHQHLEVAPHLRKLDELWLLDGEGGVRTCFRMCRLGGETHIDLVGGNGRAGLDGAAQQLKTAGQRLAQRCPAMAAVQQVGLQHLCVGHELAGQHQMGRCGTVARGCGGAAQRQGALAQLGVHLLQLRQQSSAFFRHSSRGCKQRHEERRD